MKIFVKGDGPLQRSSHDSNSSTAQLCDETDDDLCVLIPLKLSRLAVTTTVKPVSNPIQPSSVRPGHVKFCHELCTGCHVTQLSLTLWLTRRHLEGHRAHKTPRRNETLYQSTSPQDNRSTRVSGGRARAHRFFSILPFPTQFSPTAADAPPVPSPLLFFRTHRYPPLFWPCFPKTKIFSLITLNV